MKKDCLMKFSYLLRCSLAHPSKTVSEKSIEHTSPQVQNRNSASASCLILWTTLAHRCLESDYPAKRCLQYVLMSFFLSSMHVSQTHQGLSSTICFCLTLDCHMSNVVDFIDLPAQCEQNLTAYQHYAYIKSIRNFLKIKLEHNGIQQFHIIIMICILENNFINIPNKNTLITKVYGKQH